MIIRRPALLILTMLSSLITVPTAVLGADEPRVSTLAEVEGGTGGLVVDARGNVYSADFGAVLGNPDTAGTRLFRITPAGETSVFASGFEGASGVAIDRDGNFHQANIRGGYLSTISPDGTVARHPATGLRSPVGVVIDDKGTIFVANCGAASVQRITADGTSSRFVESDLLKCPNGLTLDDDGNLYAANFYSGDVVKITPQGEATVLATLPGNNNGHIVFVEHAVDGGALYVVARAAHQIYRVALDGTATLFAGSGEQGSKDGPLLEASFTFPNDIAVSPDGKRLYVNEVADPSTKGFKLAPTRVRVIDL